MIKFIDSVKKYFSIQSPEENLRSSIEGTGDFFVGEKLRDCFEEVAGSSTLSVIAHKDFPNFLIKTPKKGLENCVSVFYKNTTPQRGESNSLLLRVDIANQMREIIKRSNLTLLYVPQKWNFTDGRCAIIVERLDLDQKVDQFFDRMDKAFRMQYIAQVWKLIEATGHQDIMFNLAISKIDGVMKLVIFDTEPYGMTCSTLEERLPKAMDHFLSQKPFMVQEKLEVMKKNPIREEGVSKIIGKK